MKKPITTKDLGAIHELCLFEQWAATKYKALYDMCGDQEVKDLFEKYCLQHSEQLKVMYQYLKTNSKAGGAK